MSISKGLKIVGKIDADADFFLHIDTEVKKPSVSSEYIYVHGTAEVNVGGIDRQVNIRGQLNLNQVDQIRSEFFNTKGRTDANFIAKIDCVIFECQGYKVIPIKLSDRWESQEEIDCGTYSVKSISVSSDDDGDYLVSYVLGGNAPFVASVSATAKKGSDIPGPIGEYFSKPNQACSCFVNAGAKAEKKEALLVAHCFTILEEKLIVNTREVAEVEQTATDFSALEIEGDVENYDSDNIVVRFALTKGDGVWPKCKELSKAEKANPISMAKFVFDWDPDGVDGYDFGDMEILEADFLYDGVTYLQKSNMGLRVFKGELTGYPSPIVKFKLSKAVNVDAFRRAVWGSVVSLRPSGRTYKDESFFCEDHNGYTDVIGIDDFSVLTDDELIKAEGSTVSLDALINGITLIDVASQRRMYFGKTGRKSVKRK